MRPIDPKALKVKKRPPAGRTKSGARHLTKAVVIEPVLARDALRSLGVGEWRVAPHRSPAARLEESLGLARAINLEVRAKGLVRLPHPRPATLFGCGKVAELEGLIRAEGAEVVIVDISSQDPQRSIRTIELIRATTLQIAIFASGEMTQPANIVASMRAGAGEYLDSSAGSEPLLEALTRFSSARTRSLSGGGKARVFTFLGAKGGAGCTTAAVNTALALQQSHGDHSSRER